MLQPGNKLPEPAWPRLDLRVRMGLSHYSTGPHVTAEATDRPFSVSCPVDVKALSREWSQNNT